MIVAGDCWLVMLIVVGVAPVLSVIVHVVVAETSTVPDIPETVASAEIVPVEPRVMVTWVGLSVKPITLLSDTVTVEVPLTAPDDAVTVAVPALPAVTLPPVLIEAIEVSLVDQNTPLVKVFVLPSS